jgi:hypothetical protein
MPPPDSWKRAASLPSPSKSRKGLATATATSSAKKSVASRNPKTPLKAKRLSSLGFSSTKRPAVQIGVKLLLDDSTYLGICPSEVTNHMFVYEVVKLFENGKAKVKYLEQVVKEGGNRFLVYKEGEKAQVRYVIFPLFVVCKDVSHKTLLFYSFFLDKFLTLKLIEIAIGHETWCKYNTHVSTRLSVAWPELEQLQQAEVIEVDADLTDINKLFEKKG